MIGKGAFGQVFKAKKIAGDPKSSSKLDLCVKVCAARGAKVQHSSRFTQDQAEMLVEALMKLRHPNIVKYYEFIQDTDQVYVVMDRCRGLDLPQHIEAHAVDGLLPLATVRTISQQILSAVAAVHETGMMHRDIKLDNFRFQDERATTIKLLDFGMAKPTCGKPARHTITGTLLYAAPEVFQGIYTTSCDLWSVGVVIFFLLAGQLPFDTPDALILKSLHHDPVLNGDGLFRAARWRQVPAEARDLVKGLLTTDASARFADLAALEHSWLTEGRPASISRVSSRNGLPRVESAGCTLKRNQSLNELQGMKRSCFAWDLQDMADKDTIRSGFNLAAMGVNSGSSNSIFSLASPGSQCSLTNLISASTSARTPNSPRDRGLSADQVEC
jgi:serine/threonine protein kinase